MKILSCSDIHLDTFKSFAIAEDNPVSNSRLENILEGLHLFFEYGSNNGVQVYVFNGDTFNNRLKMNPNFYYYCVKRIVEEFRKTPSGSKLFINIGNHCEMTRYIHPNSNEIFSSYSEKNHNIIVQEDEATSYQLDDDSDIILIPYTENIEESKRKIKTVLDCHGDRPTTIFAHLGVAGSLSGRWSHRLGGAYSLGDLGWSNSNVVGIHLGHYHLGQSLKKKGNKEAFYEGNLVPINFNDVKDSGLGLDKGFWLSDSITGEHELIKTTDVLPTFNIIDLANTSMSSDDILTLAKDNYVRLIIHNESDYKDMKEKLSDSLSNIEIQLKKDIEEVHELDINETTSDSEIVKKYFSKYYPDNKRLMKKALEFLEEG